MEYFTISNLVKSIGMEQKNNKPFNYKSLYLIFLIVSFALWSCNVLDNTTPVNLPLRIKGTYTAIPKDSMVSFPRMVITDTVLNNAFDAILYLDSIYLTHSKKGEKSWYEVNITAPYDTIIINLYAHQYAVYERPLEKQFDGVILYRDNFFLIRGDSAICDKVMHRSCDSLEFNSISTNTTIYYILDTDYNYPEYATIKYYYYNGYLQKQKVEVNNYILENGYLHRKN